MNVRNRWFLLLAGLLSLMLVLAAACGGDEEEDKTPTGKTPAATSATGDVAPADQQKITIQSVEPQYYDPHRSNFEQDIGIERMLFRGLYNLTDDGKGGVLIEPAMAAAEPTISGNEYTVKLKSGLKWSDGQPLTANDFVFGTQLSCSAANASPYQYLLGEGFLDIVGCDDLFTNEDAAKEEQLKAALGVKATDDTTLVYTLTKPNGRFTTIMSLWIAFPAPKHVVDAKGDAWTAPENIVVNGPYTLASLTPKSDAVLKPNPNWSGKKPAVQEITFKFFDDFSQAFRAYQTGELDITRIQETDVSVVNDDASLKKELAIVPSSRIDAIHMYLGVEVLKDFNVRLAISRAIDRDTLNDVVYDGINEPATYWVVKGLTGFQGNEPFDSKIGYDADAAKKALADAGYPNGQGFPELTMVMRDDPVQRNLADFLVKGWKDTLGITVNPEFVDGPTRSARFNQEDYQLFRGGWQLDYPDIENPLLGLYNTGGGNNHYACSDPEIDAAFQKAVDATSDSARIAAYQEVETLVVTKLCGVAPITQLAQPFLIRGKVGGVVPNGVLDAGLAGNYCPECWFVKKQ